MQSRHILQLLLAFLSLILSKAQDVTGSGPSCLMSTPAGSGLTRVTFLRRDPAAVRSLYLTLWTEDARPVACEVNADPLATARYRALCDRSGQRGREIIQRFNISVFLAPGAPCALVSSSAPEFARRVRGDGTEGRTRRKRSWFFPGTLWCGTGSQAARYDQLGMFESADRCCREHDHCLHVIPAFTANYGVYNSRFFTVSHCDCDQRFRQCLLDVNDSISHMVGYSFFSILQVPCFELQRQEHCTEMNWCKAAKKAPYAVLKHPLPFNTTVTSKYENSSKLASSEDRYNATKSPVVNPHTESPRSELNCSAKVPPGGDAFNGNKTKGEGCARHGRLHTVTPSQIPSISRAYSTTPVMEISRIDASENKTNENEAGKKNNRKGLPAYPTRTSQAPPQVTTYVYPQTALTTLKPTNITRSSKKDPNQSSCCGLKTPLRGDTFQPHCESCLRQNATSHATTVAPSTATHGLHRGTTREMLRLKKTTPKPDTRSTADPATPPTTKTTASVRTTGKPPKHTNQEPGGRTKAPNTHAVRGLKLNFALHNMPDSQLLCGSLKHLDACKYKIPPLEKKYDLENTEAKTAYHCDCTSRTAVQIKSLKRPSILPALVTDFVSLHCFKLPKEKGCYSRKSCSGGFTKAFDLLRALKKIEEKDTGGKSGNGRKRGIPVRLYKRCLRLEREADIMAQLT